MTLPFAGIARSRYVRLLLLAFAAGTLIVSSCSRQTQTSLEDTEWASYGNEGSRKYSPLDQISKENVPDLRIAWQWMSPDNGIVEDTRNLRPFIFESTPIMVKGKLYTSTSLGQVAAIDPATGITDWIHDPGSHLSPAPANVGFTNRGVAYWSDGAAERIYVATGDAFLISLDARTGQPDPSFGQEGRIDLTQGLRRPVQRKEYGVTSPPAVVRDTVIVGSSIPDLAVRKGASPGDVRGFDARTGKLLWTFHSVPQEGEFGNDTWEGGSWRHAGHTNVWTLITVDEESGYVYLPFGTPTNDYYGGERLGDNLFGDSLVCLDARSGERVWHYQIVHHGLWDYDLPAAPILADLQVEGRAVKAVVQITKQGYAFAFDRVTGEPVWPIEERPAPASQTPGERTSPTQPHPTRPAPFERQGLGVEDLIDFTPELRTQAEEIVKQYDFGPLFTPPSERGTINMPGNSGGGYWGGAAFDPESGALFVPSITAPFILKIKKQAAGSDYRYSVDPEADILLRGPQGLPAVKPPYSRVTAIDFNRGEHKWMIPLGEGPRDHPLLKPLSLPELGSGGRGLVLATRSLLFVAEGHSNQRLYNAIKRLPDKDCCNNRPRLLALDKETGEKLWETRLPYFPSGSPMTYAVGGKQFLVIAVGGIDKPAQLIAFALPD